MLEVGVTNSQRTAEGCVDGVPSPGCTLSVTEARTHFNAWCIVSAPLVLGNDLTDKATMDSVWPIISNKEAMAVNQRWVGDSGTRAAASNDTVHLSNCSWFDNQGCDHPSWMVWKKHLAADTTTPHGVAMSPHTNNKHSNGHLGRHNDVLGDSALAAVLFMNNADQPQDVATTWETVGVQCPSGGCAVRDLDTHTDLGVFTDGYTAKALPAHGSQFLLLSSK